MCIFLHFAFLLWKFQSHVRGIEPQLRFGTKLWKKGVDVGQSPIVVYYPGMRGMGKVTVDGLKNSEKRLWVLISSIRALGRFQKAEVATLEYTRWM